MTADEYEAKYMGDGAAVVHRERVHGPGWYHALFAVPAAVLAALPFVADVPPWAALPGLVVLGGSWALLSVLRTTVTRRAVHVQLGPFGPRIPVASVERVEVVDLNVVLHGWGIHRSLDGAWCYTLPVDGGRAVRIAWRDAKGRRKTTLVSSATPDVLKEAIERARAGATDLEATRVLRGVHDAPVLHEETVEVEADVPVKR